MAECNLSLPKADIVIYKRLQGSDSHKANTGSQRHSSTLLYLTYRVGKMTSL